MRSIVSLRYWQASAYGRTIPCHCLTVTFHWASAKHDALMFLFIPVTEGHCKTGDLAETPPGPSLAVQYSTYCTYMYMQDDSSLVCIVQNVCIYVGFHAAGDLTQRALWAPQIGFHDVIEKKARVMFCHLVPRALSACTYPRTCTSAYLQHTHHATMWRPYSDTYIIWRRSPSFL